MFSFTRQMSTVLLALSLCLSWLPADAKASEPQTLQVKKGFIQACKQHIALIGTLAAIAVTAPIAINYYSPEASLSRALLEPRLKYIKVGDRDEEIEKAFAERNLKLPQHKIRIMFVPQIHFGYFSSKVSKQLQLSQFRNARFILSHPNAAVFAEGLGATLTPESYDDAENLMSGDESVQRLIDKTKSLFPSGFPDKFSDLTAVQASLMGHAGGETTLWYLGLKDTIYGAESREKSMDARLLYFERLAELGFWRFSFTKEIRENPDFKMRILTAREIEALARIAAVNEAEPKNEIILIYGSAHQFESYSGKYFDIQVAIP